jgi:cyclophilin family peptidyl-prolyl cis-trans isomerase
MPTALARRLSLVALLAASLLPTAHGQQQTGTVRETGLPVAASETPLIATRDFDASPAPLTLDPRPLFTIPGIANNAQFAQFKTSMGVFNAELLSADAPNTVSNFIFYCATSLTSTADKAKTYDGTFIHRATENRDILDQFVSEFIIQGGGFRYTGGDNATGVPIRKNPNNPAQNFVLMNEFNIANTRGTIAMAKVGGNANSATNQWFVNVVDNSATLGTDNNGGFTVFARIIGKGMDTVDAIAALPLYNGVLNAFDDVPVRQLPEGLFLVDTETVRIVPLQPPTPIAGNTTMSLASVLTYSATTDNPAAATVSVANSTVTITRGAIGGGANIKIRASEAGGAFFERTILATRKVAPTLLSPLVATNAVTLGSNLTLKADFTAWPYTIQWQRRASATAAWENLTDGPRFSGSTTQFLTIRLLNATPAEAFESLALQDAQFRFIVTGLKGTAPSVLTAAPTSLRIITGNVSLATVENLALPGLVAQSGRTFTATGLPSGLSINSTTGRITGTTTAAAGFYRVTITVNEGSTSTARSYYVEVRPLALAGSYEALLSANETTPPAAKLALTITSTGALTGSLVTTEEKAALSFRGTVLRDGPAGNLAPTTTFTLSRPGAPSGRSYVLTFAISATGVPTATLQTRASASSSPVFLADAPVARPGARLGVYASGSAAPWAYQEGYTIALTAPTAITGNAERAVPAGSGYARITTTPAGIFNFTGKTADGAPFTASLASGNDGTYRLLARPYGALPGAYVSALLRLTAPEGRYTLTSANRNFAFWARPAGAKSPTSYAAGFMTKFTPRMEANYIASTTAIGFKTTRTERQTGSDGVPRDVAIAGTIAFTLSGVEPSNAAPNTRNLPTSVELDFTTLIAKAVLPVGTASGFTGKFVPKTSLFTGSFNLSDPGSTPTKPIIRKVTFEAILVSATNDNPNVGDATFEGFMTVPQLNPLNLKPAPAPLSGRVQFKKAP